MDWRILMVGGVGLIWWADALVADGQEKPLGQASDFRSGLSGGIKPGRCEEAVNLIDIDSILSELCGLPARAGLDGLSLVAQLEDVAKERTVPSITFNGTNRNSLRTKRGRYIRYDDGSEELYDHDKDPMEWANLAGNPEYASVIGELCKHIPKKQVVTISRKKTQRGEKGD